MIPLVAIVGRPNVGKSTLFNRLVRSRKALVQDDPGVTRDRHYGTATYEGRVFNVVDTGGFEPDAEAGIEALVREQTQLAIDEADLVLVVMDARQGLTEADLAVVDALRRSGKPVLHVANKVDGPTQEALAADLYRTGAARLYLVSAEHGLGFEELIDAVLGALPAASVERDRDRRDEDELRSPDPEDPEHESTDEPAEIRLALVGRPNAGKSSLLNVLVGQPRAIVSPVPGTTRDPVDVRLETPRGAFVLVDTAGIRRHSRSARVMEKLAIIRALQCISNSDVACLVIDAREGVAEQDAKIAGMALDAGRGLVIAFTKSDLLPGPRARRPLGRQVEEKLQFVRFAPVLFLSAVTRQGIGRLLPTVRRVHRACGTRLPTAALNRLLEEAVAAHAPPTHRGRAVRFYYITQPQTHPPTFVISTSYPEGVHVTYQRFLVNRLRERIGFEGTPIRLFFRQRGKER